MILSHASRSPHARQSHRRRVQGTEEEVGRVQWTEEEVAKLKLGLARHEGKHNLWKLIEQDFFVDGSRTNVDLKDKARHLGLRQSCPPTRRPRTVWTPSEDEMLVQGRHTFGDGNWAKIRRDFFVDGSRTNVDLKDRCRTLTKRRHRSNLVLPPALPRESPPGRSTSLHAANIVWQESPVVVD